MERPIWPDPGAGARAIKLRLLDPDRGDTRSHVACDPDRRRRDDIIDAVAVQARLRSYHELHFRWLAGVRGRCWCGSRRDCVVIALRRGVRLVARTRCPV